MAEGGSASVCTTLSLATIANEGSTKDHLFRAYTVQVYSRPFAPVPGRGQTSLTPVKCWVFQGCYLNARAIL